MRNADKIVLASLIPDIIDSFSMSLTGFLPFSFFIAWGMMLLRCSALL